MVEAIGSKVLKLVRTAIGPIEIGGLKIGTWRLLDEREIDVLNGFHTRSGTSGRTPGSRARGE